MSISGIPYEPTPEVSRPKPAEAPVAELQTDVERLMMITEALWNLLKEKHGYDDNELIKQITMIDMADGKLDGRVNTRTPPQPCPKCNRILVKNRPRCIYCGEPIALDPFER